MESEKDGEEGKERPKRKTSDSNESKNKRWETAGRTSTTKREVEKVEEEKKARSEGKEKEIWGSRE